MSGVAGGRERVFVGMGSNLGERLANLQRAAGSLAGRVPILRSSRIYETEPIGPPQPRYLNSVLELAPALPPPELLGACLAVEASMGRERGERWGPRVIDLDLLSYGRRVIDTPGLSVPHPRMHERGFVLVPLLELDPNPVLPEGMEVGELRVPWMLAGAELFAPALPLSQPEAGR